MRLLLLLACFMVLYVYRLVWASMASPRIVPLRSASELEPPAPPERIRRARRTVFDLPVVVAMGYLFAIVAAELTTVANHWLGLPAHTAILFALLLHGSSSWGARRRALLWSLALAPLIR